MLLGEVAKQCRCGRCDGDDRESIQRNVARIWHIDYVY